MNKKILVCIIVVFVGMISVGFYSAYSVKKIIENRSFEIRTKKELDELILLQQKNYADLLFRKSVYLFGNITQIQNDNFHIDDTFCKEFNEKISENIVEIIEKKVVIAPKEKEKYYKNVKALLRQCSTEK